jgi:hypothetical protein
LKKKKLHIQIIVFTLKMALCRIMSKIKIWKKVKTQDSMGKTKFFIGTQPFSLWAILATWLYVGAPQTIQENWTYNPFWTKIHHGLIWSRNLMCLVLQKACAWCCKKLVQYVVHLSKRKNRKKIYSSSHWTPK